mmetsp:Transcript_24649/g.58507  ORF Transcript_24649/g.58507 Transcript_24649/m.58507 type:complete len:719 (-) Transcript_24649:358-2514(-)
MPRTTTSTTGRPLQVLAFLLVASCFSSSSSSSSSSAVGVGVGVVGASVSVSVSESDSHSDSVSSSTKIQQYVRRGRPKQQEQEQEQIQQELLPAVISSNRNSEERGLEPVVPMAAVYDPSGPNVNFQAIVVEELISDASRRGLNEITIPPGYYKAEPPTGQKSHLYLQNLKDFTIHADNVHLVCTKTTRAITIVDCHNLTINGFMTVDYDPLPFTQGVITSIGGECNKELTIELQPGYNDATANMINFNKRDKIEIYDPTTLELSAPTYYNVQFSKLSSNTVIKATLPSCPNSGKSESIGDVAVIKTLNMPQPAEHGIVMMGCTNLVMDSVALYSSTMFGFFETDCSSSTYKDCIVDRRSPSDDLYPPSMRPMPRLRSLTADAFHSKHAVVGPTYDGVTARYMGDDGVAINGHYHLIMKTSSLPKGDKNGSMLRVIGKFGEQPNIAVGDTVEIVSRDGRRIDNESGLGGGGGSVVVTNIQKGSPVTDGEREFLTDQNWMASVKPKTIAATETWDITIDKSLKSYNLPVGSLIASSNRIGNGFKVINSTIGPNRSRGILVKASQGLVKDNTLVGNWGMAIKASPEYFWLEAGSGSNIRIQGNTITGCRDVAIAVYAKNGNDGWAPSGAHKNIVIAQNTIRDSTYPNVCISAIETLDYYGNRLGPANNDILMPYNSQEFGRNGYQGNAATRKLYQVYVTDIVWNDSRDTINVTPLKNNAP